MSLPLFRPIMPTQSAIKDLRNSFKTLPKDINPEDSKIKCLLNVGEHSVRSYY
jgi:hypothetical protein